MVWVPKVLNRIIDFEYLFFMEKSGFYKINLLGRIQVV
ncbi:hypothetical protein LEP1GSC198_3649 [Leptospira kirschneri str. JB]|nr:hypothetical protein LEP1GSC198_3649 [Leptospira kirschneri str. JB]